MIADEARCRASTLMLIITLIYFAVEMLAAMIAEMPTAPSAPTKLVSNSRDDFPPAAFRQSSGHGFAFRATNSPPRHLIFQQPYHHAAGFIITHTPVMVSREIATLSRRASYGIFSRLPIDISAYGGLFHYIYFAFSPGNYFLRYIFRAIGARVAHAHA